MLWRRAKPTQLFVGSFGFLIVLGTLGLKLLPGLYTGEPLGWLDAAFTATSAVCVTGLIVVDTATFFTPAGQTFILLLIQLGGIGMITFTTLIILTLGRHLSLRQEMLTGGGDVAPHIDARRLARDVVRFTLLFEAAGAVILFLMWAPDLGALSAAGHAVFHAISAFCNAGFSTFSDSLMAYQRSPFTLLLVMALIVLGGIGFLTMEEVYLQGRARRAGERPERFSLHSFLVLTVTAVLLLAGWALFTTVEWGRTLAALPAWAKVANGLFMSVTARTAGFNTVDYAQASDGANFLTVLLMFMGGSPGSMAGGIKTTTVAIIALLAWARLRGRQEVSLRGRTLREETVQRAVGLAAVAFVLVTSAILLVVLGEGSDAAGDPDHDFLAYMFEATSAFNTVGLSMGVTADLSPGSRALTILLMYIGRVGPLAFAASIALPYEPRGRFRYAYEEVVVG